VVATTVPASLGFASISLTPAGLRLTGTATLGGDQGVACLEASVDPATLALLRIIEPRCDDPALAGKPVMPVQYGLRSQPNDAVVRIARIDSSNGRIEVGPVLMTYGNYSDTHLESAYGPGSLWLYASASTKGPMVLRVSEATGQVVQATRIPDLDRPVIAADAAGLYLAPAANSLGNFGDGIIYHLGIGARSVAAVDRSPGFHGFVSWMTGQGEDLWADICPRQGSRPCEIARFNGERSLRAFQVSDRGLTGWWVAGDASSGFYSSVVPRNVPAPSTTSWRIVRIDPSSGAVAVVATIDLPLYWTGSGEATVDGHALFVLTPPEQSSNGELYRVAL